MFNTETMASNPRRHPRRGLWNEVALTGAELGALVLRGASHGLDAVSIHKHLLYSCTGFTAVSTTYVSYIHRQVVIACLNILCSYLLISSEL